MPTTTPSLTIERVDATPVTNSAIDQENTVGRGQKRLREDGHHVSGSTKPSSPEPAAAETGHKCVTCQDNIVKVQDTSCLACRKQIYILTTPPQEFLHQADLIAYLETLLHATPKARLNAHYSIVAKDGMNHKKRVSLLVKKLKKLVSDRETSRLYSAGKSSSSTRVYKCKCSSGNCNGWIRIRAEDDNSHFLYPAVQGQKISIGVWHPE
ncbi:hypothetical protein DL96DRAFT_1553533 [Flagelloscypha sp. PMI_526]|nr:hypothetical protein DL96DRAFT_1553533 [Flagelloscypha sp. PMI_526]